MKRDALGMKRQAAWPWRRCGDGIELLVRAQPGARRGGIHGLRQTEQGLALVVAVPDAPEKGKANRAIAAVLAKALGVARSDVVLQRGERQRLKLFRVAGASEQLAARLAELTGETGQ